MAPRSVITFNESLGREPCRQLTDGDFTVQKTPGGRSRAHDRRAEREAPVISGQTVTLMLATALASTDGPARQGELQQTDDGQHPTGWPMRAGNADGDGESPTSR